MHAALFCLTSLVYMDRLEAQKKVRLFVEEEFSQPEFAFLEKIMTDFDDVEVFLVGGAIRDILIEREAYDFDFVVRNIEPSALEDFLVTFGKLVYVGKQFGVYKLRPYDSDNEIDIAFPRREVSTGPGYKEFEIISDPRAPIQEDLVRRDFTVNAFAYSLKEYIFIDESNGLHDIKKRIVRTVGDPKVRFSEDYTRILRSVRQSIQLDFEIESNTRKAITEEMVQLEGGFEKYVSHEMISKEFLKAFSIDSLRTIEMYEDLKILKHVLPEIMLSKGVLQGSDQYREDDIFEHIKHVLSQTMHTDSLRLKLAALFIHSSKPLVREVIERGGKDRVIFLGYVQESMNIFRRWASKMKISQDVIQDTLFLIEHHLFLWQEGAYDMKFSQITHTFLKDYVLGKDLVRLHYFDISYNGDRQKKALEYIAMVSNYFDAMHDSIIEEYGEVAAPISGGDVLAAFPEKQGGEIGYALKIAEEYFWDRFGEGVVLEQGDLISFIRTYENERTN